jgi:hypothetical protein
MVYPGLASWAKFSRPYGTKFVNPGSDADSMAPEGLILKAQDFEPLNSDAALPALSRPPRIT